MRTKKANLATLSDYIDAAEMLSVLEGAAYKTADTLKPILTDTEIYQFKSGVVYKIQREENTLLHKAYEALPLEDAKQVDDLICGRLYPRGW